MLCEIPEFGRCCFCLPLRRGLHVYLILLVRSFLKKLETPAVSYDNQLYQFVNHEIKDNVVCSSIVVPNVF
ncbi:unnamed protein product [Leptidea sinapis]|uniref:Uncharacterized protein n=1 Tax=Leptidea sinapis TaxID=189913 RepID=A0A5E4QVL0_9NEOP|nr:unnamed protein product [Leptidea sinapis]